jgi:hypothetical protein
MAARVVVIALGLLALPGVSLAQPEDRLRVPTGGLASADPCANVVDERQRAPELTSLGADPWLPASAGATSFSGIAPLGRDPSRELPRATMPDQAYQTCRQRVNR